MVYMVWYIWYGVYGMVDMVWYVCPPVLRVNCRLKFLAGNCAGVRISAAGVLLESTRDFF